MSASRFEASTIIRQAWPQLPDNLSYPSISLRGTDDNSPKTFLSYTLTASETPIEIQQFAENYIKPQLAQINGVYKVDVSGANPMEWQLEFDNNQLNVITSYSIHYTKLYDQHRHIGFVIE